MTPDLSTADPSAFNDADLRRTMLAAMRLLAILAAVAAAIFLVLRGWPSGLLVLIGAAISAASLWEWLRLMAALNERMDAGATPRPMGRILLGFFLRLALTVAVLYGSLKWLHGTVFGLAVGLGLGMVALAVEALRLTRRGAV